MLHDEPTGRKQAAMMATARYAALYLQERGQLVDVYRAVRDRGFDELAGPAPDHAVALVEAALGQPIEAIDAAFVAWFRGTPRGVAAPRTEGGVLVLAQRQLVPGPWTALR